MKTAAKPKPTSRAKTKAVKRAVPRTSRAAPRTRSQPFELCEIGSTPQAPRATPQVRRLYQRVLQVDFAASASELRTSLKRHRSSANVTDWLALQRWVYAHRPWHEREELVQLHLWDLLRHELPLLINTQYADAAVLDYVSVLLQADQLLLEVAKAPDAPEELARVGCLVYEPLFAAVTSNLDLVDMAPHIVTDLIAATLRVVVMRLLAHTHLMQSVDSLRDIRALKEAERVLATLAVLKRRLNLVNAASARGRFCAPPRLFHTLASGLASEDLPHLTEHYLRLIAKLAGATHAPLEPRLALLSCLRALNDPASLALYLAIAWC